MAFSVFHLDRNLLKGLKELGFSRPTPIQTDAIPPALEGRDVLACASTGSGKTAAFLLPILNRLVTRPRGKTRALVLTPTRELAVQIVEQLNALAIHTPVTAWPIIGGVGMGPQEHAFRSGMDVLVATPGRLLDHLRSPYARLDSVEYLVLDEADRMLDMGFQPQVDQIVRRLPRNRQTMFFSATLDGEVGELARAYTNSPSRFETEPSSEEPGEIDHHFVSVTANTKVDTLIEHIESAEGLTLVFARTKRGADRLVQKLGRQNVSAVAMHGDMSQRARERALAQFESGRVKTLVATDVAARGLDLDDVTQVINFDPPDEAKGYVHRTGRTGRAGRDGTAITLVLPEQQAETSHVARRLGHSEQFERAGLKSARPKLLYTSRNRRRSKW